MPQLTVHRRAVSFAHADKQQSSCTPCWQQELLSLLAVHASVPPVTSCAAWMLKCGAEALPLMS